LGDQKIGDKNVAIWIKIGIEAEMSRYLALNAPSHRPTEKPFTTTQATASGTVMTQISLGDVPKKSATGISTTELCA
jgi:hypothetical protein